MMDFWRQGSAGGGRRGGFGVWIEREGSAWVFDVEVRCDIVLAWGVMLWGCEMRVLVWGSVWEFGMGLVLVASFVWQVVVVNWACQVRHDERLTDWRRSWWQRERAGGVTSGALRIRLGG